MNSTATAGMDKTDSQSARTGETLVEITDVSKTYDGETLVIEGLNLDVQRGEFLTLLGPSGSGKTTVLMMLAGFETPTGGTIRIGGQEITRVPPYKRDIGVVFQNYALFPHMTVAENLRFPLDVRGISRKDAQQSVERALEIVRLQDFGNRKPNQLSGGQQQRVAVARALVFEPKLVLLDEPLGALDKNLREEMQIELKHIHQQLGVTMVYVTHDQGEALTMSDRVAVFDAGEIQQLAEPDTLYDAPGNAFVAGFIGKNNRLNGKVESSEGDHCLVQLDDGRNQVKALDIKTGGPGSRTSLSVRPERIRIGEGAKGCDNAFEARILETIFMGDHIRVGVDFGGEEEFIIQVPNTENRGGLQVGNNLHIGWQADDCRALDPA
ncbi:ABC transporter ATP-binding protein [Fodinicurvata halophila]|uniref:Spermidine/putrescine import ATP-binding protein PotA n=1 Tax=Fodinicurvata halophila TaxID=1419723 RepID=A0ABV8UIF0_9PROT